MKKIILYILICCLHVTNNLTISKIKLKKRKTIFKKKKLLNNKKNSTSAIFHPLTSHLFDISLLSIHQIENIIELQEYEKILNNKKIEYESNIDIINKKIIEIQKKMNEIQNIEKYEDNNSKILEKEENNIKNQDQNEEKDEDESQDG